MLRLLRESRPLVISMRTRLAAFAVFTAGCVTHSVAPSQLFAGACNRYANTRSYEDIVTIDTIYPSRLSSYATDFISDRTVRSHMRTAFRRPDSVRLDFENLPPHVPFGFTIWSQRGTVRDWSSRGDSTTFASLDEALAAYQGVSTLGSYLVPQLLIGGTDSLCRVANVGGDGGELQDVAGASCRVLRLSAHWGDHLAPFEVCIDASYAIRQWRTWSTVDGRVVSTVATYQPRFEIDAPDNVFEFQPPPSDSKPTEQK
jgi:hypothetical protein